MKYFKEYQKKSETLATPSLKFLTDFSNIKTSKKYNRPTAI